MYSGELKSAFAEVKKLDGSLARHTGEEEESIAINQLSFISEKKVFARRQTLFFHSDSLAKFLLPRPVQFPQRFVSVNSRKWSTIMES